MTTAQDRRIFALLATVIATLALILTACDSAKEESPASPANTAQPAAPAAKGDRMASIDANGNIAPFGFASKKVVPVAERQIAAPQTAATSVVFGANCVACHGPDARGVQGLGLNLVESRLVADSSPAALIEFLQAGRPADAPDNVTKVPMPSFAWMSDADLTEVATYLKGLNPG